MKYDPSSINDIEIIRVSVEQKFSRKFLIYYIAIFLGFLIISFWFGYGFLQIAMTLSVFLPIFGLIFLLASIVILFCIVKIGNSFKEPYVLIAHTINGPIKIMETNDIISVNSARRNLERSLNKEQNTESI